MATTIDDDSDDYKDSGDNHQSVVVLDAELCGADVSSKEVGLVPRPVLNMITMMTLMMIMMTILRLMMTKKIMRNTLLSHSPAYWL